MAILVLICGLSLLSKMAYGHPKTATNATAAKDMGRQESITFYKTNGSSIDLSAIPKPLLTNVTAENMVAVAPVTRTPKQILPWSALRDFTVVESRGTDHPKETIKTSKRNIAKIEKGAALIPKETGIQSIALPPLLTLNNNMSKIPVPIPNVSLVSYAKVNTVVHNP